MVLEKELKEALQACGGIWIRGNKALTLASIRPGRLVDLIKIEKELSRS